MLNALLVGLLVLAPEVPAPVRPATSADAAKSKQESKPDAAGDKKAQGETGLQFRWRDHPQVRTERNLRVDFEVKLQLDVRDPGDDPPDFNDFQIQRFRLGFEGEVFRHIQFAVERELTERETDDADDDDTGRQSAWKDVYVEANFTDKAQFRMGKFKIPFGLDELTGISNLDFVYRARGANYLAPARDWGGAIHGRFYDRGLNYWAGVFRQDGENARSSNIEGGGLTFATRVTGTPFRKVTPTRLQQVEVGGAFTVSALSDASGQPNGLRGRTAMSQYEFFEPVFVKGVRRRYEVDVDWYDGPFGARGEYILALDTRDQQGLADQTLPDARARAWFVSGTWLLTGENKERPMRPQRKFGAVEVVARYDRLWFDSVSGEPPPLRNPRADLIYPNGDRVLSLGINWYVNRWVRLEMQTIREQMQDPERSPVPDDAAFWSPVFRLQFGI